MPVKTGVPSPPFPEGSLLALHGRDRREPVVDTRPYRRRPFTEGLLVLHVSGHQTAFHELSSSSTDSPLDVNRKRSTGEKPWDCVGVDDTDEILPPSALGISSFLAARELLGYRP